MEGEYQRVDRLKGGRYTAREGFGGAELSAFPALASGLSFLSPHGLSSLEYRYEI